MSHVFLFNLRWNSQQPYLHAVCSTGPHSPPAGSVVRSTTVLGALGLEERIGKNFIPQSSHCPAARALGHITSLLKHLQQHRSPYPPPSDLEIKLPIWVIASPPASPASLFISPPPSPLDPDTCSCSLIPSRLIPLSLCSCCLSCPSCFYLLFSSLPSL